MRIIRVLIILSVGFLVLWEVVAQGTRTWTKYKLLKEPLPSLTALLPTSLILPVITTLLIVLLITTTVMALLRSRKIFGIVPIPELMRHAVVVGPTGSGKTSAAKAIIAKAMKSLKSPTIIVIDWKGEYSQFMPTATVIKKIQNVWDVPGESAREKALLAVELIREMGRDVIDITPPSSLLLLRVLEEEYKRGGGVPTTEKVLKVLERSAEIAQREYRHAEANMYLALARRLYLLLVDEERVVENIEGDPRIIVYDLKGLPSVYLKNLYANFIIANVYRRVYMMSNNMSHSDSHSEMLKFLLIAEEAQNYIRPRRHDELPSLAERLVFELRSFGVGAVLVCPDPELLPSPILKDVGTIIATSPDSLPRFVLERHLFRASLEEAEDTLKRLKKSRAIIYYQGRLFFLRRLPRSTKTLKPKDLRLRPKGDRMGANEPGVGSLRAWPILPHRSPGRPATEVKKEVEEEPRVRPEIIESRVREETTIKEEPIVDKLKLEEEVEEAEAIVGPIEKETVEVKEVEVKEEIEEKLTTEEMPMTVELEPAPEGPPIPSSLPYRGSLCPAGRSATLGRVLF
jgi:hypothetical protein